MEFFFLEILKVTNMQRVVALTLQTSTSNHNIVFGKIITHWPDIFTIGNLNIKMQGLLCGSSSQGRKTLFFVRVPKSLSYYYSNLLCLAVAKCGKILMKSQLYYLYASEYHPRNYKWEDRYSLVCKQKTESLWKICSLEGPETHPDIFRKVFVSDCK